MAGFTPKEGAQVIAEHFYNQDNTDRGINIQVGLFKNTSGLDRDSVLADIVPITGGGYAPITLIDGTWLITDGIVTRPSFLEFTPVTTDFDAIYGYYAWLSGTTSRLLHVEVDPNAPVIKTAGGDPYVIDLSTITGI